MYKRQAIGFLVPDSEALSHQGATALGILGALVALWVTSALPLGATALLVVVLCPVLGVVDNLGKAIGGFASPALLFIIAVFSMPVIMLKTNWGVRLINALIGWTGANSVSYTHLDVYKRQACAGRRSAGPRRTRSGPCPRWRHRWSAAPPRSSS